MMKRVSASQVVTGSGGCHRCASKWDGKTALANAARHHDKTRHPTWGEQTLRTEYGAGQQPAKTQGNLL